MLNKFRRFLQLMGLVLFIVLLIVLFAGLILANEQSVAVGFWGWTAVPMSLPFVLFLAFFIGAAVGLAGCLWMVFRLRMRNASLQRKLKRRDAELQKLRVSALRGLSS
ncbi:LapA family protein [Sansalvadorimonas sp. 2012CJ34-2]|uniref:LapA family protein n=1 Tax=Parendozoicomonas callyspongiae TaxID=2942213 RepID=A0ABT0PJC3_9GAMM|nr:LapA family protein [Sansalvadorimonas sp. 2012CJ34-2]MCL6271336.1 LapA family protein [Sansalvadorimonas sp. 2012CJ34-2]